MFVAVVAATLAWSFGARSLNAVAAPAVVGLLAAVVQVALASDPTIERTVPEPGFPDQTREMTLDIEGGTTVVAVSDTLPDGLVSTANETTVSPPRRLSYPVEYASRGVHTVGPTTVTTRDVFGLVQRTQTLDTGAEVTVYPEVYSLAESGELSALLARGQTPERQEFDDLREYVPGDPLRDIHWKSSAKRDGDLIVKEFTGREPERAVTIAGSASRTDVDDMAAAIASIALALVDSGLAVEVTVPSGSLRVGTGFADRVTLLEMLARTGPGNVDGDVWTAADVTVSAANGDTSVAVGDRTTAFEEWQSGAAAIDAALAEQAEVSAP